MYRRVLKEARLYHAPRYPIFERETAALKLLSQNRRFFKKTTRNIPRNNGFFLSPLLRREFRELRVNLARSDILLLTLDNNYFAIISIFSIPALSDIVEVGLVPQVALSV